MAGLRATGSAGWSRQSQSGRWERSAGQLTRCATVRAHSAAALNKPKQARVLNLLVRRAAAIKARGGISYADAFAAAAASVLDCPVLTGDPEFRVAEEAGVTVRWLGRRA